MKKRICVTVIGLLTTSALLFSGCGGQTNGAASESEVSTDAAESTESVDEDSTVRFTYKNISSNPNWNIIELPVTMTTAENLSENELVPSLVMHTEEGEELPLILGTITPDSFMNSVQFSKVFVGYCGNSVEEDLYFTDDCRAWFLESDESKYVWIDYAGDDGRTFLVVCNLSQDTPEFVNAETNIEGKIEEKFTDPDSFEMTTLEGTSFPTKKVTSTYHINASGVPEADTE